MFERDGREGHDGQCRQGEQVDQGLGEDRPGNDRQQQPPRAGEPPGEHDDARRLADAPREERGGHHADHRRPHHGRPRDMQCRGGRRGASAARRPSAAGARSPSAARASASQPGVAVMRACPIRSKSRRETAKATRPARAHDRDDRRCAAARPRSGWAGFRCGGLARSHRRGSITSSPRHPAAGPPAILTGAAMRPAL